MFDHVLCNGLDQRIVVHGLHEKIAPFRHASRSYRSGDILEQISMVL
jgi:hypothetical protein